MGLEIAIRWSLLTYHAIYWASLLSGLIWPQYARMCPATFHHYLGSGPCKYVPNDGRSLLMVHVLGLLSFTVWRTKGHTLYLLLLAVCMYYSLPTHYVLQRAI